MTGLNKLGALVVGGSGAYFLLVEAVGDGVPPLLWLPWFLGACLIAHGLSSHQ